MPGSSEKPCARLAEAYVKQVTTPYSSSTTAPNAYAKHLYRAIEIDGPIDLGIALMSYYNTTKFSLPLLRANTQLTCSRTRHPVYPSNLNDRPANSLARRPDKFISNIQYHNEANGASRVLAVSYTRCNGTSSLQWHQAGIAYYTWYLLYNTIQKK
ncbi:hypothetical protein BD779DRAFT_1532082 [Infundibulicybe gibba]|nr:hypothetical protein BD779DRAFT_1532082 [Infundibulicybe gibba]